MSNRRPPSWNARRRRRRQSPVRSRDVEPHAPETARDGGWPAPPFVGPTPRALSGEDLARPGPYEDAYEIRNGYHTEREVVDRG